MRSSTKLTRNLKPGDRFVVTFPEAGYKAVVTVTGVVPLGVSRYSGKKEWRIDGEYPWWWPGSAIIAQSKDRTDVLPSARRATCAE